MRYRRCSWDAGTPVQAMASARVRAVLDMVSEMTAEEQDELRDELEGVERGVGQCLVGRARAAHGSNRTRRGEAPHPRGVLRTVRRRASVIPLLIHPEAAVE